MSVLGAKPTTGGAMSRPRLPPDAGSIPDTPVRTRSSPTSTTEDIGPGSPVQRPRQEDQLEEDEITNFIFKKEYSIPMPLLKIDNKFDI